MKKKIFHRLIRRLVWIYRKGEEALYGEDMAYFGEGAHVQYPYLVRHPELIKIGAKTEILSHSRIQCFPELSNGAECGIEIGNNCCMVHRICILSSAKITIGNNVLMASDVNIVSHNHGMDPESEQEYMSQGLISKEVKIGDGCWLGQGVMVMPGVTIGKKCIIGAGGVVTHDVPDYSIAVGIPAKVIKRYSFEKHCWENVEGVTKDCR